MRCKLFGKTLKKYEVLGPSRHPFLSQIFCRYELPKQPGKTPLPKHPLTSTPLTPETPGPNACAEKSSAEPTKNRENNKKRESWVKSQKMLLFLVLRIRTVSLQCKNCFLAVVLSTLETFRLLVAPH